MDVLSFSSEDAMYAALRQLWIDFVKEKVADGIMAKTQSGALLNSLTGLDDSEIAELKLCGKFKGEFVLDNGTTIAYADGTKAYNIDKWYFGKPPDKYMTGVADYTIEPYDSSWEYPESRTDKPKAIAF